MDKQEYRRMADGPKVLNIRTGGQPPGAVFIGRPSAWGNMFIIGRDGDREEVVRAHKQYIEERMAESPSYREFIIRELKGRDLVCFCAPEPCHGDTLLEIANG